MQDGKPATLRECPVGMLLREAPWTFEIAADAHVLFNTPDVFSVKRMPQFYQLAISTCQREYGEQEDQKHKERETKQQAKLAAKIRKHR